ncbi:hypothetical protein Hypma_010439 [Hypsizygus marmoreus]|uniref:DUF7223 domain-containing protein n=1 Tax=Hypsizygus marmoreus TaxID=39966 RepID=A0A369KEJ5_HYPMA|nr:hypothetical protein Hypma_010439 [Hypsizygus marmoreus]
MPSFPYATLLVHILLLLPLTASAARRNDWSKPCFGGECFYDLPEHSAKGSGSLKIWGSPDAISDITAAAGWTVLGCSKDALIQDIRLVCNSEDTKAAGCDHLFRRLGKSGKIVRLPENCGKNAFARVAKVWDAKDQNVPTDVAGRISRRPGFKPQVKALTLDTNFAAIDPAETGEVSIAIQGATVPGYSGNLTLTPPASTSRRGFWDWIEDVFDDFNNFDESITKTLTPIDVNKNWQLFSQSISCPGPPAFSASISSDVTASAHAVISVGVAAVGTIIPPQLTEFGLFAGLDAALQATLGLRGNAAGRADTGQLTLFQLGIPGLDFPGILTIGPTFKVLGQATATLDINVDMTVDVSYNINQAKLFFPPSPNHPGSGIFNPGTSGPLKVSVSPSLNSRATAEAHVIPRLDVGISAIGGAVKAAVYLDLDASASVVLTLNAAANTGTGGTSASVDGCVDADAGLNVHAGADGSFFGLFDKSTAVTLFSKQFDIYQKCFSAAKRDSIVSISRASRTSRAIEMKTRRSELALLPRGFSLACPAVSAGNLVTLS